MSSWQQKKKQDIASDIKFDVSFYCHIVRPLCLIFKLTSRGFKTTSMTKIAAVRPL